MEALDLSGADLSGFEPIPAGTYDVKVAKAEWGETSGSGKMPAGTPRLNVHLTVDGGEYDGRYVFANYTIPPASYDPAKGAKMKGMFVRFLIACGYDEKKILDKKFTLDVNDLLGMELRAVVAVKPKYGGEEGEMDNDVKGIKSRSEGSTGSTRPLV